MFPLFYIFNLHYPEKLVLHILAFPQAVPRRRDRSQYSRLCRVE